MTDKKSLLYLFDRPTEPIFAGKGNEKSPQDAGKVYFELPNEYLPTRYQSISSGLDTRFQDQDSKHKATYIPVTKLSKLPDISFALALKRDTAFCLFNSYHNEIAGKLIELLMSTKNFDELLSLSLYLRDRINSYLFIYALSVVVLHRPDTRNLELPSHAQMFPGMYVNSTNFGQARQESNLIPAENRVPIEIPNDFSANDLDIENRVNYFREDIGLNLHHWHWHLVYPYRGPRNVVAKDRRGELFYYMHQQMMGRYNMERLCNDMARTKRLTNWYEPIAEGYFPKLDNLLASRTWPSRPPNSILSNINREVERLQFDIEDLERWRDRIYKAIHTGTITDTAGQKIRLTEFEGIDILGDLVEASILSRNPNLYGNLHNSLHNAISYIHDPDSRYLEDFNVVGDPATAMRDPVFYRVHAFIDDIFQEFKSTLPSYNAQTLGFENVQVQSVEVNTTGAQRNVFTTFWQQSTLDLSRGIDFLPRGPLLARVTHLQHTPFTYKIVVQNNGNQRMGTVRLFMAPRYDERGLPILFNEQRKLMVELDKFSVQLQRGRNEINRQSIESSVTIPYEQTFRNVDINRAENNSSAGQAFNFCGCGWPQHMLIAKGNAEGFACQLFVMVSNGANDTVENSGNTQSCDNAASYCGILNSRYPDARSMGFPFDRVGRDAIATLQQFLTPNMAIQDVRIFFTNRTQVNQSNRPASQNQNQNQGNRRPQQGGRN
ncbi:phenoloxidase 1-like [Daktulosphaira vitifoliae]|uniref:phenoloxidase 1-like n=1 Tax=Daktulosphaira vitifoliae TaxID=58002 RepID=UPI0021A9DDEA|nr:phenoloxidase 1-like [Daktulosphaira vitifoliae]